MEEYITYEKSLSFAAFRVTLSMVGQDCHILFSGGEKPHIGCAVLAVPRPSLKGDGAVSCTSSVLNLPGHKDEEICRYLAERVCVKKQAVVVCTGGFHVDGITGEQIAELIDAVKETAARI